MAGMRVVEYMREDLTSPYQRWFDSLAPAAAARVTVAKARMELGNTSNIKWFDGLGEYRIDWGPGLWIYLARDGDRLIVLFGGGDKSTQKADIRKARALLDEYRARKRRSGE